MDGQSVIQVFEHQKIKVGEEIDGVIFSSSHFHALRTLAESQQLNLFAVEHEAIRFKSYVGVVQAGSLCIEILPKLDQWLPSKSAIQGCLIEMLRICRFLKVTSLNQASLSLKPMPLMDLFWEFFLEEAAGLLKEGLLKSYSLNQSEKPYLKGRLLLHRQLQLQATKKESFHTAFSEYNYNHPFNVVIYQALQLLQSFPLSPWVQHLLRQTLNRFPVIRQPANPISITEHPAFNWKSKRYKNALLLAHMILGNKTPDVRSGSKTAVAMVFDMNLLFEEYIYRQLLRYAPMGAKISHQANRLFWLKRTIRPDIVIRLGRKTVVIDTKWKLLTNSQPSMNDLRQMYVYNRYFEADKGILLYPKLASSEAIVSPFHGVGEAEGHGLCEVSFVELVKEGKLNVELGEGIWRKMLAE